MRPRPGSPLIKAGAAQPRYLNASQVLEVARPECEPSREVAESVGRAIEGVVDIGAFEAAGEVARE